MLRFKQTNAQNDVVDRKRKEPNVINSFYFHMNKIRQITLFSFKKKLQSEEILHIQYDLLFVRNCFLLCLLKTNKFSANCHKVINLFPNKIRLLQIAVNMHFQAYSIYAFPCFILQLF